MSKAKDKYYKKKKEVESVGLHFNKEITDYIQELQQQNKDMIELFFLVKDRISDFEYDVNRLSFIQELIDNDLEKITGKSIDEVIK